MAEYIEREALIEALRKYQYPYGVEFLVSCQPAADVVSVVRCRDCKHKGSTIKANGWDIMRCNYHETVTFKEDGFCCFGERKEQ